MLSADLAGFGLSRPALRSPYASVVGRAQGRESPDAPAGLAVRGSGRGDSSSMEDQGGRAGLAATGRRTPAGARDRRLQHLPAPLRGRLHRPVDRQRHLRALTGAAGRDGARRRGLRGLAQLLPPRAGGRRRLRLPPHDPDPPGPRRRAPAGEAARPAGPARALEPLLHHLARACRAGGRHLGRRLDPGGGRPDLDPPVQGQRRPRASCATCSRPPHRSGSRSSASRRA